MTKTLVAKRTIHRPGPKFKPMKIDPMTGGKLDAGLYDVEAIPPGKSFKCDDDHEADKLVASGCAVLEEDDKSPAKDTSALPSPNPAVPPKK